MLFATLKWDFQPRSWDYAPARWDFGTATWDSAAATWGSRAVARDISAATSDFRDVKLGFAADRVELPGTMASSVYIWIFSPKEFAARLFVGGHHRQKRLSKEVRLGPLQEVSMDIDMLCCALQTDTRKIESRTPAWARSSSHHHWQAGR